MHGLLPIAVGVCATSIPDMDFLPWLAAVFAQLARGLPLALTWCATADLE